MPSLERGAYALVTCAMLVAASGCSAKRPALGPAQGAEMGTASLYLPGRTEPQTVRYVVVDGEALMGGDIRLGPVERLHELYGPPSASAGLTGVHTAVVHANANRLWPDAVIPYVIDGTVSEPLRQQILMAIADVNQTRLVVRPKGPLDRDYVIFNSKNSPNVCDSHLGRIGGEQPIRVNGCGRSAIVHEILHAAGFDHEHQRSDRDAFVQILWENVDPAHRTWLERIDERRTALGPYDYDSVMHYQATAFSRNGKPTIVPRLPGARIRGVERLSPRDIEAIAQVYGGEKPTFPGLGGVAIPGVFGGGPIRFPGLSGAQLPIPGPPQGGPWALPSGVPDLPGMLGGAWAPRP